MQLTFSYLPPLYCLSFVSIFLSFTFCFRFSPPTSEVLKFAWIQYIAFFAVISFLLTRLSSFLFRHQVMMVTSSLALCCHVIPCHTMFNTGTPHLLFLIVFFLADISPVKRHISYKTYHTKP